MKSKIIISGPQASGKTHIALAMRSLFEKEEVIWLTPPHHLHRFYDTKPKLIIIDQCKDITDIKNLINKVEMRWENIENISIVFQTQQILSQAECLEFTLIKTSI